MAENSWDIEFAKKFKERDNPPDLKEGLIGVVVSLSPLTVSIENGQVILTQNDQLIISEWFQKRWDIDKTMALSVDVLSLLGATSSSIATAIHSYTGTSCSVIGVVDKLNQAITKINAELFALKLDLKLKDKIILLPSDVADKYFVIDKV